MKLSTDFSNPLVSLTLKENTTDFGFIFKGVYTHNDKKRHFEADFSTGKSVGYFIAKLRSLANVLEQDLKELTDKKE